MRLNFVPTHVFRETPQVSFFDAGVKGSNGSDVVIHHSNAISPPNDDDFEQYYIHQHQIDHNLVIEGSRIFTLINPEWDEPHHIIYLNRAMGALQIPIGTYHRSISNKEGSIVLNQAVRDEKFNPENEFIPVSLRDRKDLQIAQKKDPVYWIWEKDQIKRIKFEPIQSREKNFLIVLKLSHDTKEATTTHSASRIEGSDFLLGKPIAFRNHNSYMDEIFP